MTKNEANKRQRQRDIASKKYYCSECDKAFRDKTTLDIHLNGLKHHPERKKIYKCEQCNFSSKIKTNYNIHLNSRKHINKTNSQV